jgi:cysteine synthase A
MVLAGVGEFLKSKKSSVKIMAVEPEESPYLSLGKAGRHGIEGIGAGRLPMAWHYASASDFKLRSESDPTVRNFCPVWYRFLRRCFDPTLT